MCSKAVVAGSGCRWYGARPAPAGNVAGVTTETAPPVGEAGAQPSGPTTATPSSTSTPGSPTRTTRRRSPTSRRRTRTPTRRTAHLAALRETLFNEIKPRTKETDLSVPSRKGGYWYYTRTVEGKQYGDPLPGRGPPTARPTRRSATTARRSTARRCCSTATAGRGARLLRARHVRRQPGRPLAGLLHRLRRRRAVHAAGQGPAHRRGAADEVPDAFYGSAWSADGSTLFYITVDEAWRPAPGVAAHRRHRRPPRTWSSTRRPTSGSGSASSLTRSREVHPHRRAQQGDQRGPGHPGRRPDRRAGRDRARAGRASSTRSSTTATGS